MRVNLNQYALVRLTESGRKILRDSVEVTASSGVVMRNSQKGSSCESGFILSHRIRNIREAMNRHFHAKKSAKWGFSSPLTINIESAK